MLLALALALLQQPVTVDGRVLDSVTGLPVPNARVVLVRLGQGFVLGADIVDTPVPSTPDPQARRTAALTDAEGRFRFELEGLADFGLWVNARGYVIPARGIGPANAYRAKPGEKNEIVLRIERALSISGRILADDTGKPLSGLAVTPRAYRLAGPGRMLMPAGATVTTDAQGRFTLERLAPGDYYIQVAEPLGRSIEEAKGGTDFRDFVERLYAEAWYPGVPRAQEALPVKIVPGVPLEGVEFKVARSRLSAIRGRIFGEREGDVTLALGRSEKSLVGRSFSLVARGKSKPGSTYQVNRLLPGSYWLTAAQEDYFALLTFEITEENLEGLDLHLRHGLTVTGRVRIENREPKPDEPALPDGDTHLDLRPLVRVSMPQDRPAIVKASDGTFIMDRVLPDRYAASLAPAPKGYGISEVRYNGAVCPHGILTLDTAAHEQKIEITLAEANGSVTATVTDGAKSVPGAAVILVPEPVNSEMLSERYLWREAKADADGRAVMSGLLPGAYRLVAWPSGALWADDASFTVRVIAGQEVRVAARQNAIVQIRAQ